MTNSTLTLSPHLELRNSLDSDHEFCRALYASTRDDLRQLPLAPAMIADLIQMQQHIHEAGQRQNYPAAEYMILEHRAVPVGRAVVEQNGDALHLIDIALLPSAQNHGFGTALLRALQQRAQAAQLDLTLSVFKSNTGAQRLYQRLGFEIADGDMVSERMRWRTPITAMT